MRDDNSQLMTRPYLGRADGYLTLHTGDGRRGASGGVNPIGAGAAIVMIIVLSAAVGFAGVMV